MSPLASRVSHCAPLFGLATFLPASLHSAEVIDLATLSGDSGFRVTGINSRDYLGEIVNPLGDFNGDGLRDLLIGSHGFETSTVEAIGACYVIFGSTNPFPANIAAASLDGTNGFAFRGIDDEDLSATSASGAGDVNGDGLADVIIGAPQGEPATGTSDNRGEAYVIFGSTNPMAPIFFLDSLNGTNGFRLTGADPGDRAGWSVAGAGDFNGDSFADVIVGAFRAEPNGGQDNGEAYLVLGRSAPWPTNTFLTNGSPGVTTFEGVAGNDWLGWDVGPAGDFNQDGFSDILLGAPTASLSAGQAFLVFGRPLPPAAIDLAALNGTNGIAFEGSAAGDFLGSNAREAGDINGDSLSDILLGAPSADPGGRQNAGTVYLLYGTTQQFSTNVSIAAFSSTHGAAIHGAHPGDRCGLGLAQLGDFDGDGLNDFALGSRYADPNNRLDAGETYILFGQSNALPGALDLALPSTNLLRIQGIDPDDYSGFKIAGPGDINGDGLDDLLIGAFWAEPDAADSRNGEAYVVFGSPRGSEPGSSTAGTSSGGATGSGGSTTSGEGTTGSTATTGVGSTASGSNTGGSSGSVQLPLDALSWKVVIKRPKNGKSLRLRPGKGIGTLKGVVTEIDRPAGSRIAAQWTLLRSSNLAQPISWSTITRIQTVNKGLRAKFVVKNVGAAASLQSGDALTLFVRASSDFSAASTETTRVDITIR